MGHKSHKTPFLGAEGAAFCLQRRAPGGPWVFPTPTGVTLWVLLPLPAPLSCVRAPLLPCSAVTRHPGLLQLGSCTGRRGAGGMGARGCLGPLLLLLLPPLPWGEHRAGGSGVGSESLAEAVASAGGDGTWLQPSIIGGHEARLCSRPYMVSLQFGGVHACGAALLHRRWALTAAHCLSRRSWHKGRLVVGLHRWRDHGADTQNFAIRAACPHPGYDPQTMENDLLLLQLDGKVTLSRTRRLISLASREPTPGTRCSLAGWGVVDPRDGSLSPTLQELEVTVMDTRMCNNSRFWSGEIGPAMICFQGQRRGSAPAKPPVATSTVKHKKWIQKTLRRGCGSGQLKHTG
ncbi:granzyme M-like isoform X2 [Haemorhous mexicanus]|uniref:granzyme M-like isoform X2 n=1 Tax=Haemorhous mexicanus TaxID=30427 RepID=UPI0028BE1763|nr:granzyme M-like isoform X2 [Haemorhous mexicanus]